MPCFVYCRRGSWRPIGHMRPPPPAWTPIGQMMPCFVYCRRGSWCPIGHMRPSSRLLDSNWSNDAMFCVLQAGFLASYWSHASLLPPPGLLLVKWCYVLCTAGGVPGVLLVTCVPPHPSWTRWEISSRVRTRWPRQGKTWLSSAYG